MKLAKKVLSVVLAVVMALGAFAVVGSANGNPDADYQVKIWLTGTVGEVKWTSATKLSMSETGEESAPGGTIEVQPGDEVFVRFYITNNYYVHTFQTNVFYSSGLIDAAELYTTQTGKSCSAARVAKMHLWNDGGDHYWTKAQGTANAAANAWGMQTPDFNANVEQNWPTDDEGNNLFNMEDWKFNRFNNLTQEKSGETCIWEEEVWLFSMPVSVPLDAKPGDTFYVTIPEGLEQRDAKQYGALRLSEIGIAEGESEPCDIVDAQALLNPNMKWGNENQYYDLSKATITLQVPGAASVDTTELEAKIAEAADLLAGGNLTAASIAALNDAITAGNAALTSNDQGKVDEAVDALVAAINAAEGLANYADLEAAIERYEALNPADWANFADATAAYNTAKAIASGLGVSAQGTIDAAAAELNAAIDALVAALDYSALEAKYNELANKNVANYTDATAGRFNTALATAKSLIDNKNAADQDEIDAAYDELVAADAALALKAADYSALDAAIEAFEDIDAKAWTVDSYAAAKAKYDEAKAVARDLDITAQATVDAAAAALNAAIDALVPAAGANYAELDAAIAAFEALVPDHYTTDSYAAAKAAYDAAKAVARDLTANDQAIIDDAAAALNAAIKALVPADADYSAVNAAIIAADAILNKKDGNVNSYSDATLEAINAAKATVVTGLKKKDQAQVDEMAAAINAAIANAEFRAWDYSKILAHIEAIEAKGEDYYKADSYAAYLAKKDALVMNYTYEFYAKAMLQEINFLKVTVAAADPADYSAVNDAIEAYKAKKAAAEYTDDSIAAVDAEIAKVVYGLNENHQDEVDAFAAAINAAIDAMVEIIPVEPADYTAVNDAIAAFRSKIAAADYEQDGIDAVEAIIAGINWDLDETAQATVDAYAADIIAATAALVEIIPVVPADYTALDAAIRRAGTYDQNAWTADTWAVVAEKLVAAKAVARDLTADDQAIINDAAKALNDALDALVAKEVVSSISTITYTPAEDTHNTFDVVVNGRMAMVQFIEEDGGTRTYDRYNKNVTIVSYNANGEVVNSLSRDVAYEIWTINTNLIGPKVDVRTKYLSGASYIWETERYSFELQFVEPTFDAEIREINAPESGKKGKVVTTVVVGPDAEGIKFVMANGTTTTYTADKATVLENGDLSFTGNAWANDAGLNTIVVKVKVNGAWVEKGAFDYTVE